MKPSAYERIAIARWANRLDYKAFKFPRGRLEEQERLFKYCDKDILNSLVVWAASSYNRNLSEKSDEDLKWMISQQFGYAHDEKIDPSRVITNPDVLVVGTNYAIASNGYCLGKYMGSMMGPSHPGAKCGCNGTQRLFSFEKGDRGPVLFEIGVFATD
jgi:hypothetical protein